MRSLDKVSAICGEKVTVDLVEVLTQVDRLGRLARVLAFGTVRVAEQSVLVLQVLRSVFLRVNHRKVVDYESCRVNHGPE